MSMKMQQKNEYRVKDLHESAYLYVSGKKLLRLDKENNFYWFIFEDQAGCRALIDSYWRRESSVCAKDFADAIRSLRDRILSLKES